MGFEITYKYYEEVSKGEYNKEEVKSKTVKVGSPYDDISLEILAGKVMAQLARRNILVTEVEIYEFAKKKISFKEASDGILIKNKKFSFDDGAVMKSEEISEEEPVQLSQNSQNNSAQQLLNQLLANPAVAAVLNAGVMSVPGVAGSTKPVIKNTDGNINIAPIINPTQIMRYEIYNPADKIFVEDARKRGFHFTVGKKYPILAEKPARNMSVGMLYTTIDDKGKRQIMSDKFFTPDINLSEKGFEQQDFKPLANPISKSDGLDWSSFSDDNIPSIR